GNVGGARADDAGRGGVRWALGGASTGREARRDATQGARGLARPWVDGGSRGAARASSAARALVGVLRVRGRHQSQTAVTSSAENCSRPAFFVSVGDGDGLGLAEGEEDGVDEGDDEGDDEGVDASSS